MNDVLWIGSDHYVRLSDVVDEADDTPLTTGTCTFLLEDSDGNTVANSSGTASHVSGGDYRGIIDGPTCTANLEEGARYNLVITFNQGNYDREDCIPLQARRLRRR